MLLRRLGLHRRRGGDREASLAVQLDIAAVQGQLLGSDAAPGAGKEQLPLIVPQRDGQQVVFAGIALIGHVQLQGQVGERLAFRVAEVAEGSLRHQLRLQGFGVHAHGGERGAPDFVGAAAAPEGHVGLAP